MQDHYTTETLTHLVRLGRWDDDRIAAYLAIDVNKVRAARARLPKGRTRKDI